MAKPLDVLVQLLDELRLLMQHCTQVCVVVFFLSKHNLLLLRNKVLLD